MKKVVVGLVALMFAVGAMACGDTTCKELEQKCEALTTGKEICRAGAGVAEKAGADACKAFLEGFDGAKSSWEAAGAAEIEKRKTAND